LSTRIPMKRTEVILPMTVLGVMKLKID